MHRALYRKWRPQTFDDVYGQDAITNILKYEVANGKTSHAYLFCGSRGTGKTTCAKILAKAVNCLSPIDGNPCNACESCRAIDAGTATDVVEMDAASNTSVDNVRDIKEEIVFSPAALRYRVYIIDEVHMLSTSAFNALLKTLEEPPEHVLFILATTELQKLPSTVISRCQRFDFRRIATDTLVSRLQKIAEGENIVLSGDGARIIARLAAGGMRDAISLFELCAGQNKEVTAALVSETLGVESRDKTASVVRAIADKNYETIYGAVNETVMSSRDLSVFFQELTDYYRDMMIVKTTSSAKDYLDITDEELSSLTESAKRFTMPMLTYHTQVLEEALYNMQRAGLRKRSIAELALTKMCDIRLAATPEALVARMDKLEQEVASLRNGVVKISAESENNGPGEPKNETTLSGEVSEEKAKVDEKPLRYAETESSPDVYRPFPGWSDVVEAVGRVRPQILRFLETAKAYKKADGSCLIRVRMSLGAGILRRDENLAIVRNAAADIGGENIRNASFTVETVDAPTSNAVIEEIEEMLGEGEQLQ